MNPRIAPRCAERRLSVGPETEVNTFGALLQIAGEQLPHLRAAGDEPLTMPIGVKPVGPRPFVVSQYAAQTGDFAGGQVEPQPPDMHGAGGQRGRVMPNRPESRQVHVSDP